MSRHPATILVERADVETVLGAVSCDNRRRPETTGDDAAKRQLAHAPRAPHVSGMGNSVSGVATSADPRFCAICPPWVAGVYFVTVPGFVKIGIAAKSIRARVMQIQALQPHQVDLIAFDLTETPRGHERGYHSRFRAQRIRGEWFELRDDLLEFLLQRNAQHAAKERVPA